MTAHNMPATTRRRFIQTAAAAVRSRIRLGLGARLGGGPPPAVATRRAASGLADAVLEAFKTHRLVGLGEIHGLQNHGDALALLLADPRLPGVVDDIVVEFGNALYQHTIDGSSRPAGRRRRPAPGMAQHGCLPLET